MFLRKLRLGMVTLLFGAFLCAGAVVTHHGHNAQALRAEGADEKRPLLEVASETLPELVALAEKDVAIKRAAVQVAGAQKAVAEAKLNMLKRKVKTAQTAAVGTKGQLDRLTKLYQEGAVDLASVKQLERDYQVGLSQREESEEAVLLGEAEVTLEVARRQVALAELDKTELRLKQLRDRLKAKK